MSDVTTPVAASTDRLFEIKRRWNGNVLFSLTCGSMRLCVEAALKARIDLRAADLSYAVLSSAVLSSADLRSADLSSAVLSSIKSDFLAEVLRLPNELEALRDAITEGRIDGSTYSGECAGLAGTLAKARGLEDYDGENITIGTFTFHASASSPRETFFAAIKPGDTPDKSSVAKVALDWTNEAIAIRDAIRAPA